MADERVNELWDEAQETIDEYAPRDAMLDDIETYYFAEDKEAEESEEQIQVVKLPWAENVVGLIQDLLANAGYTLAVPAPSINLQARRLAEDAEKFVRAVIGQSEELQDQDFMSRLAWIAAMRGAVAGRVMFYPEWMEEPEDKDGEWATGKRIPVMVQLRDPRNLYPSFGLDGLKFIVERQTRTVRDIRRSYGEDVLLNNEPGDKVEWLEYWDKKVFQYWADGEAISPGKQMGGTGPVEHRLGDINYVYAFCRQTGKIQPDQRARPMLAPMRPVIARLDALESMRHTFIADYIGTGWLTRSRNRDLSFDKTPGAEHRLDFEESIEPIQAGRQPLELDTAKQELQAHFERGTFPGTFYGEDPGRVMSGFAINLLNQGGQSKLNPMVGAIERLTQGLAVAILRTAELRIAPLTKGAIPFYIVETESVDGQEVEYQAEQKLDAEKLQGRYNVNVQMGELLPEDELTSMQLAQMARTPNAAGIPLLSDASILEKYRISESPTDERREIILEAAQNSPEIVGLETQLLIAQVREQLLDDLEELDIDTSAARQQVTSGQQLTAPTQELQVPPEMMQQAQTMQQPPPEMMQPGPAVPPEVIAEMGIPPAEEPII